MLGLADLVIQMRDEDRLCIMEQDDTEDQEPRIICSMGLFNHENEGNARWLLTFKSFVLTYRTLNLTGLMVEGLGWNHHQGASDYRPRRQREL